MEPARGEPDEKIPGNDRLGVRDLFFFHYSEGKSSQVILPIAVEGGHLCRLPADQDTAGKAAAVGDAADHLQGGPGLELAGGEIVEKKKRLSPLRQDIVHPHGHEVDAHRIVGVHHEGDLELGPDPVCGRDQNRVAVLSALEIKEGAETADAGQQPGAGGLKGNGTDTAHQPIGSGNIHSGSLVGCSSFT